MATPEFAKARRHLKSRDPVLNRLIRTVGKCTLRASDDYFATLARSIISQQISTKAALSISTRLVTLLGRKGLRPRSILGAEDILLRQAGLSANKAKSLRDLAEKCQSGAVPLRKLRDLSDEEVIERLLPVRGIGRWTAEMFLIFALGRLDVLPVGDYGLRAGVLNEYQLNELPDKATLLALSEPWRPYRTVGTWFIWRSFGNVPQSDPKTAKPQAAAGETRA